MRGEGDWLVRALRAGEEGAREALGDWLEENGDRRAGLVRLAQETLKAPAGEWVRDWGVVGRCWRGPGGPRAGWRGWHHVGRLWLTCVLKRLAQPLWPALGEVLGHCEAYNCLLIGPRERDRGWGLARGPGEWLAAFTNWGDGERGWWRGRVARAVMGARGGVFGNAEWAAKCLVRQGAEEGSDDYEAFVLNRERVGGIVRGMEDVLVGWDGWKEGRWR